MHFRLSSGLMILVLASGCVTTDSRQTTQAALNNYIGPKHSSLLAAYKMLDTMPIAKSVKVHTPARSICSTLPADGARGCFNALNAEILVPMVERYIQTYQPISLDHIGTYDLSKKASKEHAFDLIVTVDNLGNHQRCCKVYFRR